MNSEYLSGGDTAFFKNGNMLVIPLLVENDFILKYLVHFYHHLRY
ncbi:hypothetical protein B488_00770 [Liberibacter crescens BT-1]|uniref:Uncharacterized protein n=1 Tax=Liberibacter crescens (strain BT-1) TaxID=1215343 RepID=L0ETC4_LIBCB|nr:hypothetical protein B488_00770 [Liberibacter crescens BT-1]